MSLIVKSFHVNFINIFQVSGNCFNMTDIESLARKNLEIQSDEVRESCKDPLNVEDDKPSSMRTEKQDETKYPASI